jgi:hypothetical protein
LKGIACVALLALGCTTVRAPASAISPVVPVHDGAAEPQVELWLESAGRITPEESARAAAQAKAALEQALANRDSADDDTILVVRAQAVSRTPSRRSDQRAAKAGIAVGAVAVVAVVIVAIVASKGSSGGGKSSVRAASHGAARPAARPAARGGFRPSPGGPVAHVPAPRGRIPGPASGTGGPDVHVGGTIQLEVGDVPRAAEGGSPEWAAAYPPGIDGWPPAMAPQRPAPPPAISAVSLPPPPSLDVARRGFFDGDELWLELFVVDAHTGAPLWTKRAGDRIDVRDAPAVRSLIDRALGDPSGWLAANGPGGR